MMSLSRSRKVIRAAFQRFRADRSGATAIEFSLIALPFFALLFAIIEIGMFFLADQTLENAAQDSARLIMTGQVQNSKFTQEQFKQTVCSRLVGMFDCQGGIEVDVKSYKTFADVTIDNPIGADNKLRTDFTFLPGNAGDVVVVRVFYQWPLYVTGLGLNLSTPGWNNKRLLTASAAFRNEPF